MNLSSNNSFLNSIKTIIFNPNLFVRVFCVSIILGYSLTFIQPLGSLLSIVPGNLLPPNFAIWTIFTYGFMEHHIWLVLFDIIVVLMYGKVVEPLWGTIEMVRFYTIVSISVGLLSIIYYSFLYLLSKNTDLLFQTPIYGMAGYAAGLTVVLKQTMGDQVVVNNPFGKLKNKHIPLCAAIIIVIARLSQVVPSSFIIMFLSGLLTSWIYLRFYQKHSDGTRGDSAELFSFASFLPDLISPYVAILSNLVFALMVKLKICTSLQKKYEYKASTVQVNLPGTEIHDAERRRQLALKALNERLNKVASLPWPSMEDNVDMNNTNNDEISLLNSDNDLREVVKDKNQSTVVIDIHQPSSKETALNQHSQFNDI